MKKIIFILTMMLISLWAVNTNTALEIENIVQQTEAFQGIIGDWKQTKEVLTSGGFSLSLILPFLILVITTIATGGVFTVIILKLIQIFTPDNIDEKLKIVEDWITEYIIKLPITILNKLKLLVKKK